MKNLIPWFNHKDTLTAFDSKEFFNKLWENPFNFPELFHKSFPAIDISQDEKEIQVKAELPGMTEKDVEVTVHDGYLNISGEKKEEKEENNKNTYYKESYHGTFSRSIPFDNVNWEKINAKFKSGTLVVTLPKVEETKSSKVKVNIDV